MTRAALAAWCVLRSASCALLLLLLKTVFIFRNTRLLSVRRNVHGCVRLYQVCTMAGFSSVFVDTAALVLYHLYTRYSSEHERCFTKYHTYDKITHPGAFCLV